MSKTEAGYAPEASAVTPDCIFCRISAGEIPSHTVFEDEHLRVFLDIRPMRPGHVLIVPKTHHDYFEDMPADLAARVMHMAQRLARTMKRIHGVERVALMFTGVDVKHVHAHVFPMYERHDLTSPVYIQQKNLTFTLPPQAPEDELRHQAKALIEGMAQGE